MATLQHALIAQNRYRTNAWATTDLGNRVLSYYIEASATPTSSGPDPQVMLAVPQLHDARRHTPCAQDSQCPCPVLLEPPCASSRCT